MCVNTKQIYVSIRVLPFYCKVRGMLCHAFKSVILSVFTNVLSTFLLTKQNNSTCRRGTFTEARQAMHLLDAPSSLQFCPPLPAPSPFQRSARGLLSPANGCAQSALRSCCGTQTRSLYISLFPQLSPFLPPSFSPVLALSFSASKMTLRS